MSCCSWLLTVKMCDAEVCVFIYPVTLCWFKFNEISNGKGWNSVGIDLAVIEVMVSTPMLLILDLASEIRII